MVQFYNQWLSRGSVNDGGTPPFNDTYNLAGLTGDTALCGVIWGRITSPVGYWDPPGDPAVVLGFAGFSAVWRAGSGLRVHLWALNDSQPHGVSAGPQFATANATINAATSLRLRYYTSGSGAVLVANAGAVEARWLITASACTPF